ncbi:MAG: VOC family protein [Anaerolineales bacterium]|jgi:catechol 2,3-dioxygenase|nr:VOC family protein [Anaerolineales bacterium]
MTTQTNSPAQQEYSIHPATGIGHVALTVASLENQLEFYQKAMGFKLHWRNDNKAGLGTGGRELLRLTEAPDLKKYRGVSGLYHFAVLFPNRHELAIAMARLFALKVRNSPTDHVMTKTTYLDDPEGNGIELYCESPEDGSWTLKDGKYETRWADGRWSDGREPLDVDALFKHLKEDPSTGSGQARLDAPIPPETKVGHIHLHVRDIPAALDFYHGLLGFDVMGHVKDFQMAFVSAGGYHHHIGLNTWQGVGAPPPPPDAVGLRHFTVDFPNQTALDEIIARVDAAGMPGNKIEEGLLLQDPSQNGVVLRTIDRGR